MQSKDERNREEDDGIAQAKGARRRRNSVAAVAVVTVRTMPFFDQQSFAISDSQRSVGRGFYSRSLRRPFDVCGFRLLLLL